MLSNKWFPSFPKTININYKNNTINTCNNNNNKNNDDDDELIQNGYK